MDSATLLGVVGIGSTLLGAVARAPGALGAVAVTTRAQSAVEEQRARPQAYSACSTALRARRDDDVNQRAAHQQLGKLEAQRADVARTVGR